MSWDLLWARVRVPDGRAGRTTCHSGGRVLVWFGGKGPAREWFAPDDLERVGPGAEQVRPPPMQLGLW